MFVLPSLHLGGAERACVDLANGLSSLGWEITVLVGEDGILRDRVRSDVRLEVLHKQRARAMFGRLWGILNRNEYPLVISFLRHANIGLKA